MGVYFNNSKYTRLLVNKPITSFIQKFKTVNIFFKTVNIFSLIVNKNLITVNKQQDTASLRIRVAINTK